MLVLTYTSFAFGIHVQKTNTEYDISNLIKSYDNRETTRDEKIIVITLQHLYVLLFKKKPPSL